MMNYYNEHDKNAAIWLRALIAENLIPKGEVDERDIQNVRANELAGYDQCHFFAGIGGWSLALRLAGWPEKRHVWTGSCPCQPFSAAGEGMGFDDERHLWPDFRNLIGQCRPPVVFGEQVASKLGRQWLAGVRADMERAAYAFGASDLCAAGIGAPQRRQRFFWVASTNIRRFKTWSDAKSRQEIRGTFIDESNRFGSVSEHQSEGRTGMESEREKGFYERTWIGGDSTTDAVANIKCEGPQRWLRGGKNEEQQIIDGYIGCSGTIGAWDNFKIIQTKDGKNRRIPVEPAFFPLVNGFPARVALLKGFGNAIVPQVAAQFIKAAINLI